MSDCLFCKIISGEIPSDKVYEDDLIYAFNDIEPQAPVHFLVVPKKHIESLSTCGAEDAQVLAHILLKIKDLAAEFGLENNADLRNALNVFNNKESVDFTCICGDLTQNGIGSDTEIGLYSNIVANYSPNTPVYTTTGNHDCQSSGIKQSSTYFNRWKANTNLDTTAHTLTYSDLERQ